MKFRAAITDQPHLPYHSMFGDILIPAVLNGRIEQTHYCLPSTGQSSFSLHLDLEGCEESCRPLFDEVFASRTASQEIFPYGFSESQWWQYSIAPHSYLALEGKKCQVGLNYFNRFLHIDFDNKSAELVDPKVGNEMLSSTNWFDKEKGEILFASWSIEDTVARIVEPGRDVSVSVWRHSQQNGCSCRIWEGVGGDSLHQVALSPDGRYMLIMELGLVPVESPPMVSPDNAATEWRLFWKNGLVQSRVLIIDLHRGREWKLFVPTAAHVEFDPIDPSVCYISVHNIGLAHGKVCLFGPGSMLAFRLGEDGPLRIDEFSAPDFYRITTHIVFCHRGRTVIGVTGYPNRLFLIDAASMKLLRRIMLFDGEQVDTLSRVHLCRQDSRGIIASSDGEIILVAGTGFVTTLSVDDGTILSSDLIDGYSQDSCFTGHIGSFMTWTH
jgi:hypothetical protein